MKIAQPRVIHACFFKRKGGGRDNFTKDVIYAKSGIGTTRNGFSKYIAGRIYNARAAAGAAAINTKIKPFVLHCLCNRLLVDVRTIPEWYLKNQYQYNATIDMNGLSLESVDTRRICSERFKNPHNKLNYIKYVPQYSVVG